MTDREKVIRAVDSCFDYWLDQHRYIHPLELEHVRQIKADAIALLKEQYKLVNVDKLREKLGFAESCEKCKKDSWRCQRDTYFTEMDFCNRLDIAVEELTQEGR